MKEMIIKVRVSAGAKTEKIEEIEPGLFRMRVNKKAEKGKANNRVLELLAKHFRVAKSRISILSGASYKEKKILIDF